jgi:hypothetical protein
MEFYPKSSRIKAIGYDPDEEELHVTFIKGGVYVYYEVPLETYNNLLWAESVGKAFQTEVIDKGFDFKRLN